MAMESNAVATGLLVTALALVPLASKVLGNADTDGEEAATPTAEASDITIPPITRVTTPPPEITGLSESIVRVLVSNGFASDDNAVDLPESVSRTLANHGIALTIAEEG